MEHWDENFFQQQFLEHIFIDNGCNSSEIENYPEIGVMSRQLFCEDNSPGHVPLCQAVTNELWLFIKVVHCLVVFVSHFSYLNIFGFTLDMTNDCKIPSENDI